MTPLYQMFTLSLSIYIYIYRERDVYIDIHRERERAIEREREMLRPPAPAQPRGGLEVAVHDALGVQEGHACRT